MYPYEYLLFLSKMIPNRVYRTFNERQWWSQIWILNTYDAFLLFWSMKKVCSIIFVCNFIFWMAIKPKYMKITYSCTVLSQFAYGMTYLQCTKIVTPLFAVIVKLKCELFLHLISKCVPIKSQNAFYISLFFITGKIKSISDYMRNWTNHIKYYLRH